MHLALVGTQCHHLTHRFLATVVYKCYYYLPAVPEQAAAREETRPQPSHLVSPSTQQHTQPPAPCAWQVSPPVKGAHKDG